MVNFQSILKSQRKIEWFFLIGVLIFVSVYSAVTLTTKPAYWYDEAINVELSRNFADFGKLDLIIAPNTFSGAGATVGSTGYPVTLPLAGFFKLFGFGLAQARVYMLFWMSACILSLFFVAKRLWGPRVAYFGTLLFATFAPFYGNGRSVMGEIPGFLFFLLSFYFFEKRKFLVSGILLGLAVVSKPSVFVFLIPAYTLAVLFSGGAWKSRFLNLCKLGASSLLALVPWLVIYSGEISRGGLAGNIIAHFKNPYSEAGASALQNIAHNLPTLATSTTLLYFWVLLAGVVAALFFERTLLREHRYLLILSGTYLPLVLFQYLKSFGYLRYLIAAEFLVFILFLISLPVLARWIVSFCHPRENGDPVLDSRLRGNDRASLYAVTILIVMIIFQTVHLFWFSDLFPSEKTQKTIAYISREYPQEL
ncbi:MAG: glycosyltransferase family 39 protein, partial [bacterium]|nr:glycosyltransferase family 39 protein [bacterium]